jgi:periplasmic divalent cation tolerance protein
MIIVLSAFADAETARLAARTLVEERLAACASIVPQIESIYRWKGKIETSAEVLVIFKTTRECYPQFEQRLRVLHPYEVPEIIAFDSSRGSAAYLEWIVETCGQSPRSMA